MIPMCRPCFAGDKTRKSHYWIAHIAGKGLIETRSPRTIHECTTGLKKISPPIHPSTHGADDQVICMTHLNGIISYCWMTFKIHKQTFS